MDKIRENGKEYFILASKQIQGIQYFICENNKIYIKKNKEYLEFETEDKTVKQDLIKAFNPKSIDVIKER